MTDNKEVEKLIEELDRREVDSNSNLDPESGVILLHAGPESVQVYYNGGKNILIRALVNHFDSNPNEFALYIKAILDLANSIAEERFMSTDEFGRLPSGSELSKTEKLLFELMGMENFLKKTLPTVVQASFKKFEGHNIKPKGEA